MEGSFSREVFNKSKDVLLKKFSLKSGVDFDKAEIINESYTYNRNGIICLMEVNFSSEEDSNQSFGFVTKQLYNTISPKEYKMLNSKVLKHINSINSSWESKKKNISDLSINQYPDQIIGLEIENIDEETYIVKFNTLNRFVRRENSGLPGERKYQLMGYAIGRFHSFKSVKISQEVYSDYFKYLKSMNIDSGILDNWEKDLSLSLGSSHIIGDCSMDNIQYNSFEKAKIDSLSIIDPIFIAKRDRGEDLAGVLGALSRELVEYSLTTNPGSLRELLTKTFRNIINAGKELLSTYFLIHPQILSKSKALSVDFFLGTYLIQYSEQITKDDDFSTSMRDVLQVLGTQFLEDRPLTMAFK